MKSQLGSAEYSQHAAETLKAMYDCYEFLINCFCLQIASQQTMKRIVAMILIVRKIVCVRLTIRLVYIIWTKMLSLKIAALRYYNSIEFRYLFSNRIAETFAGESRLHHKYVRNEQMILWNEIIAILLHIGISVHNIFIQIRLNMKLLFLTVRAFHPVVNLRSILFLP